MSVCAGGDSHSIQAGERADPSNYLGITVTQIRLLAMVPEARLPVWAVFTDIRAHEQTGFLENEDCGLCGYPTCSSHPGRPAQMSTCKIIVWFLKVEAIFDWTKSGCGRCCRYLEPVTGLSTGTMPAKHLCSRKRLHLDAI